MGDDAKIKQSWNGLTHDSYKSSTNFVYNLLAGLYNANDGMVSGFSNTYISIDNLDYVELAKAVYYARIKYAGYIARNTLLNYYRDANDRLLIEATEIANKGIVADLQTKDFTSAEKTIINELQTILQQIINVRQIDENMTVKKALDHMGKWYVENVYTYQGAQKAVSFIDRYSNAFASEMAKQKWEEYKNNYKITKYKSNISDLKILEAIETGKDNAKYLCDKFERLEYKDKIVSDDCSRFAAAVYYHFFNRRFGITDGKGVNLKFGGSGKFVFNF